MYDLDALAHHIALTGIDRFEDEVQRIADHAYRRGIAPAAAGVLADPTAPAVARERAFARTIAAMRKADSRLWPAA